MKPALYAAAGIPHYWRLELEPVACLYLGARHGAGYTDRAACAGTVTAVTDPFPFDIDPAGLSRQ